MNCSHNSLLQLTFAGEKQCRLALCPRHLFSHAMTYMRPLPCFCSNRVAALFALLVLQQGRSILPRTGSSGQLLDTTATQIFHVCTIGT